MRFAATIDQLTTDRADNWAIYHRALAMADAGADVIELAIGEADVAPPPALVDATVAALRAGRTNYSSGAGEAGLRAALAARYSSRVGRPIAADQVLCFPGTQTALYVTVRAVVGPGDDLLIGDPMYATYEPVARAAGAGVVAVPLRPGRGFRIDADEIAARITPNTTAILLNTPHNPTGAVLTSDDIAAIGEIAIEHDLWLVVDEVYEELVFGGTAFVSPLSFPELAERVVVLSSISKSHAAPGFRSGWCVAPVAFCERVLPLSQAVLFGNQPFIADATAAAVLERSPIATEMCERFAARAGRLAAVLHAETALTVHRPEAGMFALVEVSATGLSGLAFANRLLDEAGVALMPGSSFGSSIGSWVRVSLTRNDAAFDAAIHRLIRYARSEFGSRPIAPPRHD